MAQRAPRRDAAANRAALLESARRLLRIDPDAPAEAIAAEAGLSRRSFYSHFPGREELIAAVLASGAERIAAAVSNTAHGDARVWIALMAARLWREVSHVRVMAQLAVRGPHSTVVGSAMEPLRAQLRARVEHGAASGLFRADLPTATTSRLIEAAVLDVLDEAVTHNYNDVVGRRTAMLAALSVAGLGWREANDLIDATPELAD